MEQAVGRRELNKMATRRALQDAADRLFAVNGYAATTVREISDLAGVTERTFFRYFAGKEELLVEELIAQMLVVTDRIRSRPEHEPPLVAVEYAVLDLIEADPHRDRPTLLALYLDRRPAFGPLGGSGGPLLLRTEEAVAAAIADRLARREPPPADAAFLAEVYGRTAVAVLRCVLIRDLALREGDSGSRPSLAHLVHEAFAALPSARL